MAKLLDSTEGPDYRFQLAESNVMALRSMGLRWLVYDGDPRGGPLLLGAFSTKGGAERCADNDPDFEARIVHLDLVWMVPF